MKHLSLYILVAATWLSCSHIDEDNRLIEVPYAKITRAVLVEEFTGQRCVNCPKAAAEIETYQKEYGKENVVAVAIHSGPLAFYSTEKVLGLRTSLGDEYYDYWKVEAEPSGLINRSGGVLLLDKWASKIHQELQSDASVELTASAKTSDAGRLEIEIEYLAIKDFKGRIQVWITEDDIVAPQMQPDGTLQADYIHNHIFRSTVNGHWGDDVSWSSGIRGNISFVTEVQQDWNTQNLSVVAFVYDESGVRQVCISNIKQQ